MVGFIGPNGAGKSTTVKMLTGILASTLGFINIGGLSPHKDRKRHASRIGVVFGQRTQLWWDLPVADTFDLLKYIYGLPKKINLNDTGWCQFLPFKGGISLIGSLAFSLVDIELSLFR
jgi:ABC-type uncharacterized transport system ATPase subunit